MEIKNVVVIGGGVLEVRLLIKQLIVVLMLQFGLEVKEVLEDVNLN